MVEEIAKQLSKLQLEVQNLQAQIQVRAPGIKDMSVVSLVPKWSGADKGIPSNEFLEAVERAAWLGNLSDQDKVQVANLQHHENARVFFDGRIDLQCAESTWASFKTAFRERYRDIHTDQYHFTQLQTAKLRNDESIQEFADRCRTLAQRLLPPKKTPLSEVFIRSKQKGCYLPVLSMGWQGSRQANEICRSKHRTGGP
jgi:hypothetical protein